MTTNGQAAEKGSDAASAAGGTRVGLFINVLQASHSESGSRSKRLFQKMLACL
jgi:hypothetical protein